MGLGFRLSLFGVAIIHYKKSFLFVSNLTIRLSICKTTDIASNHTVICRARLFRRTWVRHGGVRWHDTRLSNVIFFIVLASISIEYETYFRDLVRHSERHSWGYCLRKTLPPGSRTLIAATVHVAQMR